jgi:hypothetical protein
MSRWHLPLLVAVFGTLLPACESLSFAAADRASLKSATLVDACPLGVPWTRIELADTSDGITLDFATSFPPNVDELRRRVRDQAHAYGPNHHLGEGHDGEHGGPRDHGLRLWEMGPVQTDVSDTPAGAKLFVTPVDPAQRDGLRERVRQRVNHLQAADCPR